jgi:predicted DNA-binding protein with PD1-like motif
MQYLKIRNGYVVKLDSGEEIMSTLKDFVIDKKIKSAFLQGIGTGKELTLGYYDSKKKLYHKRAFIDEYEFASLNGNISYLGKEPVIHIHCTISPENFMTYAGHLFSGKVAATCEIMITLLDKKLVRKADIKTGLNLLNLTD